MINTLIPVTNLFTNWTHAASTVPAFERICVPRTLVLFVSQPQSNKGLRVSHGTVVTMGVTVL